MPVDLTLEQTINADAASQKKRVYVRLRLPYQLDSDGQIVIPYLFPFCHT